MKIGLSPLVLLAGCVQTPPIASLPTGPCLVGEPLRMRYVGVDFELAMRDDMQWGANARIARVLRPDAPGTMDVQPDRLNIVLDETGQIEGLRCG